MTTEHGPGGPIPTPGLAIVFIWLVCVGAFALAVARFF